jgi:ferredoxin
MPRLFYRQKAVSIRCEVPPPMVTFACLWRSDFMLWNTFKFIITICIAITLCLEIVLNVCNFTMLNTAYCVGLLFCGIGNSLCPSRYNMMMLPVPCDVCMTVLLYFLPSLLSLLLEFCFILPASCFCSINKSNRIFQYVVLIQNLSIFVTFVCMEFSCMLMINSFLFLVGLALYSLWAHIFALCPKLVQLIWIVLSYALCSLCIPCTRVCVETIWT